MEKFVIPDPSESMKDYDPNIVWSFPEGHPNAVTSMHYWYPRVKDLVRTPRTIEVKVPDKCNLILLDEGIKPLHWEEFFEAMKEAVADMLKPDCFIRTAFVSGKHYWNTHCHLTDIDELGAHISRLVIWSAVIDQPLDYFYVREMLPTDHKFYAFHGRMPITREFRFFLTKDIGGRVDHVQPYWPEDSIIDRDPSIENWREVLRDMSTMTYDEYDYLLGETLKLRKGLPDGDWSVDWLQTVDGSWWLIDMANALTSYIWKPDFEVIKGK